MSNIRLPPAVCAVVSETLQGRHDTLDALFESVGVPGPPPEAAHHSKWKMWLMRAGNDPNVDSLAIIGQLLGDFMDLPPEGDQDAYDRWHAQKERIAQVLEDSGLSYYRGGRVLPNGEVPLHAISGDGGSYKQTGPEFPSSIEQLLPVLVRGLPRAMYPLANRRKGTRSLTFDSEYDLQDLLHALLRPWVADIRPEEYTPSYAGSSTRMDFLLPAHKLVIELKRIRDRNHGRKVGDELIIDIEHYRRHPDCCRLWCAVYDPRSLIPNPTGLASDLDGVRSLPDGEVETKIVVLTAWEPSR